MYHLWAQSMVCGKFAPRTFEGDTQKTLFLSFFKSFWKGILILISGYHWFLQLKGWKGTVVCVYIYIYIIPQIYSLQEPRQSFWFYYYFFQPFLHQFFFQYFLSYFKPQQMDFDPIFYLISKWLLIMKQNFSNIYSDWQRVCPTHLEKLPNTCSHSTLLDLCLNSWLTH